MSSSRVARAGLQSIGGTGIQMAIQVISLVVMARLLDPTDFGIYGMAMILIGFTTLFRDLGLSSAAIQAKELPRQLRDNLWWINTGVGAGLAAITLALSPAAATFFREPQVAFVVAAMAPTMVLAGASVQYQASLQRDMRFGATTAINLAGSILGLAVSVGVAMAGGGLWALVLPQLVAGLLTLLGSATLARWLPRAPRRGQGTRGLLAFGWHLFLAQCLTYAHRNVDATLLGRLHGVDWTGQFNRASQLTRMPIGMLSGPFGRVALAAMAPKQGDLRALNALAVKGQILLAIPVLTTAGVLVAGADPIVRLALGEGWDRAVPFVQMVATSEALALMASVGGWILAARGQGRIVVRLGIISAVTKITLVSVGTMWGPYGIVAGVVTSQVVLWPMSLLISGRMSGMSLRKALINSYVLVGTTSLAVGAAWAAGQLWMVSNGPVPQLVTTVAVMGVVLALAALLFPPYRDSVRVFVTTVKSGIR